MPSNAERQARYRRRTKARALIHDSHPDARDISGTVVVHVYKSGSEARIILTDIHTGNSRTYREDN